MAKTISIFTIICLLTLVSMAQTSKQTRFFCGYGEGHHGVELCSKFQKNSFTSNKNAERAIDMILKPMGLKRNFILVSCPNIGTPAAAFTFREDGIRYIFYDDSYMESIVKGSGTDRASISILAHEVGHHLQGHTLRDASLQQRRMNELEADEFSGFVMFKLGATLSQAQAAMNNSDDVSDEENSTHPKRWRRLEAIKKGYNSAKSQQAVGNIDTRTSAEEFFVKALAFSITGNYRDAIESYTVAIGLNANFADAYYFRGIDRIATGNHQEAIRDLNQAIKLNFTDAPAAYNALGRAKIGLGDNDGACGDFLVSCALKDKDNVACKNLDHYCKKWMEPLNKAIRP